MKKEKTNWVKAYIVDVLPCITVALYGLSYVYNTSLFSVFNLSISNYVSVFDMFGSITETIITVGIVSILIVCYCFFYETVFNRKTYSRGAVFKSNTSKNTGFWFFVGYLVFVMIVSYIPYHFICSIYLLPDLWKASFALVHPILIICIVRLPSYIPYVNPIHYCIKPNKKTKYRTIEIAAFIIIYYMYAIAVFYNAGHEKGVFLLDYPNTFEIKTTDGLYYSDSDYIFINNYGDKYFLYNRITKDNVVISDNIIYLKTHEYEFAK